jgi:hypothetical protein
MLELADILRAADPADLDRWVVLPSQWRALQDILQCRTAALGGQVYECEQCGKRCYSYHSCGNRHCPKCHGQQTARWLEEQRAWLLPCPYYLVTFTLPAGLRPLIRANQQRLYGLLLKAGAASLQKLCADPQWMGAQPSLLGVLHTWTRAQLYHPHAHFLASAGGWSVAGQCWQPAQHPNFLVPVRALAEIFRAKFRAGLKAAGWLGEVPAQLWQQDWVVHVQPAGSGQKVLDYLGRYVFRIAITQSRLESLEVGHVTFRYRDNRTHQEKHVRLTVAEFVQRFLQHMLPKGFAKVRHYGLTSAACRQHHAAALAWLQAHQVPATTPQAQLLCASPPACPTIHYRRCPYCGTGRLILVELVLSAPKIPP